MYNHQLDAFLRVAELGSFNKAAESMYISPAALIQQINSLESRCGFSLFVRTNHGARLTPAGQSLAQDARTVVRLSQDALARARQLVDASEHMVRVGTSLLFKCRLLPEIWAEISEKDPDLKIEILPMAEYQDRGEIFSVLGVRYDLFEGIYGSKAWKGSCRFLKLAEMPICCAVSKNHRLAGMKKLTMEDLNGEYLVMPLQGVSDELDRFRAEVTARFPTVQIIDSSYYGVDTFTMCEVNPYILITQPVYRDIHTNLVTIPLETDYTMPYGLMVANEPTPATRKLIQAVERFFKHPKQIF